MCFYALTILPSNIYPQPTLNFQSPILAMQSTAKTISCYGIFIISILSIAPLSSYAFDLSPWTLNLPTGHGSTMDTITGIQLAADGYQHKPWFFTENSGATLVMKAPGNPTISHCIHPSASAHCRTEFFEHTKWYPSAARNRLTATLAVAKGANSGSSVVIGE